MRKKYLFCYWLLIEIFALPVPISVAGDLDLGAASWRLFAGGGRARGSFSLAGPSRVSSHGAFH